MSLLSIIGSDSLHEWSKRIFNSQVLGLGRPSPLAVALPSDSHSHTEFAKSVNEYQFSPTALIDDTGIQCFGYVQPSTYLRASCHEKENTSDYSHSSG